MALLGDTFGKFIPHVNWQAGIWTIVIAIVSVVMLCILGAVVWWYVQSKRFNKHFLVFEKVGKSFEPTIRSVARFIFVGNVNDRIFLVKKPAMALQSPTIQTGANTYWFFRRKDGELVNFGLPDLDQISADWGAEMTNQEIAYQRLALEEFAKQRVKQNNWFLENIGMLVGIGTILIVLVFLWLILGKMNTIAGTNADTIKTAKELMEANTGIANKLADLLGGSQSIVKPVVAGAVG